MKSMKDEKWLDENISRAVDLGEVQFDAQKWREKYILNESVASRSTIKTHKNFWRFIMENKITRYSVAAVVVLALILVLLSPFGTSNNSGIVWADVVEKVHQMNTVIHKEEFLFWEVNQEQVYNKADAIKLDVIKYASEEYGSVEDVFNEKGTLGYQVYLIKDIRQFTLVAHAEKKYEKTQYPPIGLTE